MPKAFIFFFLLFSMVNSPVIVIAIDANIGATAVSGATPVADPGSMMGISSGGMLMGAGMLGIAASLSGNEALQGAVNAGTGSVLIKIGQAKVAAKDQSGYYYIMAGMQHLAQAASLFGSSRHNQGVSDKFNTDSTKWPWDKDYNNVQKQLKNLQDQGYRIKKNGSIIAPNGKAYGSKEILNHLKKDPSTLNKVKKQALQMAKSKGQKYYSNGNKNNPKNVTSTSSGSKNVSGGLDGGGGVDENNNSLLGLGGGGRRGGMGYDRGEEGDSYETVYVEQQFPSAGARRDPQSLKGLNKMVNGTSIGIKNDDIFDLAHRRYINQYHQNSFIK